MTASVDPRADLVCRRGCDQARPSLEALGDAVARQLLVAAGRPGAGACGSCHAPLDLPMRASTRAVTVEPPSGEPFTLTFGLPLVRCGECGADNVAPGLAEDLRRSALDACALTIEVHPRAGLARLLSPRRRRDARGSRGRP